MKIVVIPTQIGSLNWSSDFINQTYRCLKEKGYFVVILDLYSIKSILSSINDYRLENYREYKVVSTPNLFVINSPKSKQLSLSIYLRFLKIIFWILTTINHQVLFWIFFPENFPQITKLLTKKTIIVYDCVDYFSSADKHREKFLRDQENQLIHRAHFFFVNSHTLSQIHKHLRQPEAIVPQGFRSKDFVKPNRTHVNLKKLANHKPIIGFVGGLNFRLDFRLLIPLVKNNPQWEFVLWGPIQKDPQDDVYHTQTNLNQLFHFPNVLYDHSQNRNEIPNIIKQFDIGMIPYDISQPTNKYCYPMKLFEYFYLGKPVISTPILELARFSETVTLGKNTKEWKIRIAKLLSKSWPSDLIKKQYQLSEDNSWEKKIEVILTTIEANLDRN